MKKILKYSALCMVVGAVALTSCKDFLVVGPSGKLTEEEVYAKIESTAAVVSGLYTKHLQSLRGREYQQTLLGTDELRTSLSQRMGGGYDQMYGAWDDYGPLFNANAISTRSFWGNCWAIIGEANRVVAGLGAYEMDEANQLVAEARFLRALCMFRLSVLWGEIPIVADNNYERQPLDVVWGYIIDDFRYAADVLPETQGDIQRPTKYAALAMLGKSLMQVDESTGLRDFEAADACFTEIINSGKFGLVPNYKDLWDNNILEYPDVPASYPFTREMISAPDFKVGGQSEAIFTVDFRYSSGVEDYYNCWQWEIGSWEPEVWFGGEAAYLVGYEAILPNMFMYEDQNTVAETFMNYEYPDPTDGPQLVDKGAGVWEEGDSRFEASIRYEWYYYTNRFEQQPGASNGVNDLNLYQWSRINETEPGKNDGKIPPGAPYMWIHVNERKAQLSDNMRQAMNPHVKKFEDYRCDQYAGYNISMYRTHKPFAMIRYADILLLHAECLSEMDNLGEAITEVGKVRARAWGGATPPAWTPGSKDEFRKMVMDERMRELAFEGWRRADLIRTGLFVELVKTRNDWAKENPGNINETKEIWPIPLPELVEGYDYGWTQNPGYTE